MLKMMDHFQLHRNNLPIYLDDLALITYNVWQNPIENDFAFDVCGNLAECDHGLHLRTRELERSDVASDQGTGTNGNMDEFAKHWQISDFILIASSKHTVKPCLVTAASTPTYDANPIHKKSPALCQFTNIERLFNGVVSSIVSC